MPNIILPCELSQKVDRAIAYVKAFDRMLKNLGKDVDWRNGEEVMTWWVGDDYRQITFENMEVI